MMRRKWMHEKIADGKGCINDSKVAATLKLNDITDMNNRGNCFMSKIAVKSRKSRNLPVEVGLLVGLASSRAKQNKWLIVPYWMIFAK